MSEWKEVTLQDVVTVLGDGLHGTPKYDENGEYYFINGSNLSNGKIVIDAKTRKTSAAEYKKFKKDLNSRTILVSINGTLGNVALYDNEKCVLGKSACYFNVEENVDKLFIKYVVTNRHFQEYISLFAHGTTIKNVSLKTMREYPFALPSLPEQKAITAVLASLDDKIDLLHRQNKTLEALAQTLFRHWFIDGAEDDWEVVTIGDCAQINASTVQRDYGHELIEYLDTGSITEGKVSSFQQYTLKDAPSRAKRLVNHNDIVYSTVRPNQKHYGIIKNPQMNLVVSTGFCVITCDRIDPHFIYILLTQPDMTEYLHSIAEGSTSAYPSLKPSDIASLEFQLPPKKRLDKFSKIAQSCWEKIDRNSSQIHTLEKLRDTLLPKLMSGEVRVRL